MAIETPDIPSTAKLPANAELDAGSYLPKMIQPQQESHVRFNDAHLETVHEIPHVNDLSHEEVFDVWLQRPDYEAINVAIKFTVAEMIHRSHGKQVDPTQEDKYCFRGLEDRNPRSVGYRRRLVYEEALDAVLDEQANQRNVGLHFPDKIATVYSFPSKTASDIARERAIADERDAIEAWKSPVTTGSRSSAKKNGKHKGARHSFTAGVKKVAKIMRIHS